MSVQIQPIPQGDYIPARRHQDVIYTSGMTPRLNGVLQHLGPVRKDDAPEAHRAAVELACNNALTAARALLAPGESLGIILSLTVFIAAEPGFSKHSVLADFASALLRRELGPAGIGARAAVGVATLPGNAPVEIQLIAAL